MNNSFFQKEMNRFNQSIRVFGLFVGLVFMANFAQAQQSQTDTKTAVSDMPDVSFFPNPASANSPVTIKLAASTGEAQAVSVRITDEKGRVLFTEELPDELEFTPTADRFPKGNYFLQYFQNGRLFQTEELRIE